MNKSVQILLTLVMLFAVGCCKAATFEEGWVYAYKNDYTTAVKIWLPLAEAGDMRAQYDVAVCYNDGKGVPKDEAKAVEWYIKSAEQGFLFAQWNLALMYDYGTGTKQNFPEALRWYEAAGNQGMSNAMFNAGAMHEVGAGTPKNWEMAKKWYTMALVRGLDRARERLYREPFNLVGYVSNIYNYYLGK